MPESVALRLGVLLVGSAALVALAAPWLAPLDPARQFDPAYARHLPPRSERLAVELSDGWVLLAESVRRSAGTLELERDGVTVSVPLADVVPDARGEAAPPLRFPLGHHPPAFFAGGPGVRAAGDALVAPLGQQAP